VTKWFFALCLVVALPMLADDAGPKKVQEKTPRSAIETFTDPDKAGPDYLIQGEYVAQGPRGKLGAQVVADGDGQFIVRFLNGGLPGDGWNGKDFRVPAKSENGKTTFVPDMSSQPGTGEIGGGKITMTKGAETITLNRVVRRSPTEGMKPPAGAVVLFDGTGVDAWDNGKVENGLLSVMVPRGLKSKPTFADCTLHVEFRTPFMPRARGQERGNSGVYLQGRYEVQVLDSFGLAGKNNECGGIYELSDPKVNMCYPPLQWQTYDIDFTGARYDAGGKKVRDATMTVKHNGVLIQDNVALTRGTRAAVVKEGPDRGPIHLQNHGNPVLYRNIWVVEKTAR
jgi:Domain of Unknown Function (DUF1080)